MERSRAPLERVFRPPAREGGASALPCAAAVAKGLGPSAAVSGGVPSELFGGESNGGDDLGGGDLGGPYKN